MEQVAAWMSLGQTWQPAFSICSLRNRTVGSAHRIESKGQYAGVALSSLREQERGAGARTFERGADALDAVLPRHDAPGRGDALLGGGFGLHADVWGGGAAAAVVLLRHYSPVPAGGAG